MDEIRVLMTTPDVMIAGVAAVTETGSLVAASATGSQIPAFGVAARRIWIAGAEKIVPDLATALHRLEAYGVPLEDARAAPCTDGGARPTRSSSSAASPILAAAPSCCSARPSAISHRCVRKNADE
jgi:LUD domain